MIGDAVIVAARCASCHSDDQATSGSVDVVGGGGGGDGVLQVLLFLQFSALSPVELNMSLLL